MKIQLLSDIHTEDHKDYGSEWLQHLETDGTDVLIVAGDLGSKHNLAATLTRLCISGVEKVIFVDGNHDHYQQSYQDFNKLMEALLCQCDNLIWLCNQVVEIEGVRFIGTPLWFPNHPMNECFTGICNDFNLIPDFRKWVYRENQKAVAFLEKNVQSNDIVITHYLPSDKCVHPHYAGSNLNRFFVTRMDDLILNRNPRYWFHGHTHLSGNIIIGSTHVICNPHGYMNMDLNPEYNPHLTFKV